MSALTDRLSSTIRNIPDFPKPGIQFKDITPILADASLMHAVTDELAARFEGTQIDAVVGMESRGFIFGVPLAMKLGCAFVPARKPGKLPYDNIGVEYELEYGTARLEMHVDAVKSGDNVLIVDDLLATGGTAKATMDIVEQLGGTVVGCCFVVALSFLDGEARLGGARVESLLTY